VSDELPEGWAAVQLGDLINGFQAGRNLTAQGRPASNGEFGVLKISAVTWGQFRHEENKALLSGDAPRSHEVVKRGDLLITRANTSDLVGAVAIVEDDFPFLMLPDKILRLLPKSGLVDPRFLLHALRSQEAREHFTVNATGTSESMRNLSQPKLAATPVKLPPLPEQRRIVSKVEALLVRVNAARDRLEKVLLLLKRFRQEVLARAFRGELVPTEAELAAREGRLFQSAAELLDHLPDSVSDEVPEGWITVTIDQLLQPGGLFDGPFGSSLKTADYTDSGVRVIRLENIANLRFVAEKETWISKSKYEELKRHTVGEGDIIFGSFVDESCRVCLLPKLTTPAIAKADCFCLRPKDELVDRSFLVYQLGSSTTRNALVEEIHGATRPRINTGQLRALSVALPPLAEQRRIVAKVEALLAAAAKVEVEAERQARQLERAPQAILQKAFSGELVPTEAELARIEGRSFESAAELLTRVAQTAAEPGRGSPSDGDQAASVRRGSRAPRSR